MERGHSLSDANEMLAGGDSSLPPAHVMLSAPKLTLAQDPSLLPKTDVNPRTSTHIGMALRTYNRPQTNLAIFDERRPTALKIQGIKSKIMFWNIFSYRNLADAKHILNEKTILCLCKTWQVKILKIAPKPLTHLYSSAAKQTSAPGRASGGLMTLYNVKYVKN